MNYRTNNYSSELINSMRAAFFSDMEQGGLEELPLAQMQHLIDQGADPDDLLAQILHTIRLMGGQFNVPWVFSLERKEMSLGMNIPMGRTRGEVTKTNLVRDVVLECMISSQKTKS